MKVKTYDILNAGPNNRFMCNGRIVSNSGRLFQPQNLPRPAFKPDEIETGIAALKAGCADLIYGSAKDIATSAIRGCLVAPKAQSRMKDSCDGAYKGRKLWARLNLDNPNPTAVEIARGELSAICRAVGVMQPGDSAKLHGLPLSIKVVIRTRDDGDVTNEIKGFEKREAAFSTTAPAPGAPPRTPAAQATKATPPWQR